MFAREFLTEAKEIIERLDAAAIETLVDLLVAIRQTSGRLFILGVGGSAANAAHAVNDFRKIAGIEAYAPTDNVAEITARTNDEGWSTTFSHWLAISRLSGNDLLLILSVGGGSLSKNISPNIVTALQYGKKVGAKIAGILGYNGGYTAKMADICVKIPVVNVKHITPHTEAFQAIIWHLVVTHPKLKMVETKWERLNADEKNLVTMK
jgi:D-sedoheptulose 7-phosphate isomerase